MDNQSPKVPPFDRDFFRSGLPFGQIGGGEIGGKGSGLLFVHHVLSHAQTRTADTAFEVRVPQTVALGTDLFDAFIERNDLGGIAQTDLEDAEIALAFQRASLPTEVVGDLKSLIDGVRKPLAIRSSSLLEDALARPYAGIYATKMTPNDQPDPAKRFRKLVEAIKLVYASTYFRAARAYARRTGRSVSEEKMAVLVQEVVGSRRWERFYPTLSAVGRSFHYYAPDGVQPEDGVFSLALGLGKTIVDGGACWTYSPAHPRKPAPFGSNRDLLRQSQNRFWAVRMGQPPVFDPTTETEHLVEADLADAEFDGSLERLASTWDSGSDRMTPGIARSGPRVLDFAPLLRSSSQSFNEALREVLRLCHKAFEVDVEIELVVDWSPERERPLLGLLQVRPMVVTGEEVEIEETSLDDDSLLLTCRSAIGNGYLDEIEDIVYLRPETFDPGSTVQIAAQVAERNAALCADQRPYLLVGFGRWGTTDPWGGIPVRWEQIDGARAIVEVSLPNFWAEGSQGSHFFHNVTSLGVLYLSVNVSEEARVDWRWLAAQEVVHEDEYVRHVRTPIRIGVDGHRRRGAVWKIGSSGVRSRTETR